MNWSNAAADYEKLEKCKDFMGSIWSQGNDAAKFFEGDQSADFEMPKKKDGTPYTWEEATDMYYMCRRLFNKYKGSSPAMMAEVWEHQFAAWLANLPKVVYLGIPLWLLSPIKATVLLFDEGSVPDWEKIAKRAKDRVNVGSPVVGQGKDGGKGKGKEKKEEDMLMDWWLEGLKQDT